MSEQKYKIILDAYNKTDKAFTGVRKQMDKVQKKAVTLQKRFDQFEPTFRKMRNYGALAFGAMSAGIIKFAKDASTLDRVNDTFSKLMKKMGESPAVIARYRKATLGMVDDLNLMKSANRFAMMGIAQNADEMEKLMNMAVRLGQAMGEDATSSMENFALMLANQSLPRLDTFGISSGKVRAEIERLMTANEGMTRDIAFTQAVLKYGAESMGTLGDFTATTAEQMAQLQVKLTNVKNNIGNALIPILGKLVEKITPYIEKVTEWINKNPELTAQIAIGVTALAGLVAVLGVVGLAMGAVTTIATAMTAVLGLIASPVVILLGLFALIATSLKNQIADLYGVKVTWLDVWNEIQAMFKRVTEAIGEGMFRLFEWYKKTKEGIKSIIDEYKKLIDVAKRAFSAMSNVGISGAVKKVASAFTPRFALGGVVNAPVGQEVPAILHGGEEVIPYNRRGQGQGVTVNINGGIFADEQGAQMVADKMVGAIRQYIKI